MPGPECSKFPSAAERKVVVPVTDEVTNLPPEVEEELKQKLEQAINQAA